MTTWWMRQRHWSSVATNRIRLGPVGALTTTEMMTTTLTNSIEVHLEARVSKCNFNLTYD